MNGGYDDGYRACRCFWGEQPGSLVENLLRHQDVHGLNILDLGCGEGKNAAAFARTGAVVTAIDCSELAISNGKRAFPDLKIEWWVGQAPEFPLINPGYDIVVMYGLTHCLPDRSAIDDLLNRAIRGTAAGGLHILVAFNDGPHDFEQAHPGFRPTLLPHQWYLDAYAGHEIVTATDGILEETHPHNDVPHHHSLTRMLVRMR